MTLLITLAVIVAVLIGGVKLFSDGMESDMEGY